MSDLTPEFSHPHQTSHTIQTYWNNLPTKCQRGTAIVKDWPQAPRYWARPLVGTRIKVVRISHDPLISGFKDSHAQPQREFIDDEYTKGWEKVTKHRGSPLVAHRSIRVEPDSFIPTPEAS